MFSTFEGPAVYVGLFLYELIYSLNRYGAPPPAGALLRFLSLLAGKEGKIQLRTGRRVVNFFPFSLQYYE